MDLFDKLRGIETAVAAFDGRRARPFATTIDAVLGPCEVVIDGRRTLMFGSNNYLGLTFHPEVTAAAKAAIDRHGAATTGSRVANGTLRLHRELETDLAHLFGKRRAMIFTTGHQANLSVIAGLCGPGDTILIDAESHASIHDAARLAGAELLAFRHNSAGDLARKLARLPPGRTNRLVAVEGLYSIRGDVAPLREIAAACRRHGAYLLVDEAHSFGLYGETGRGVAEAQGVSAEVDFVVGTFSKSLAGTGGFCASDHDALRLLPFAARSYLFTASASAATVAGIRAALHVLRAEPERRLRLWRNARAMRAGLARLGYALGPDESPILPIPVGSAARTVELWQRLLEAGLYVNLVLPPGCAARDCLLRASCSSEHTADQIDQALEILRRASEA